MTGRPGWTAAAFLAVAVNAICLGGWYGNRIGTPAATVDLTEREVGLVRAGEENGLLRLNLQYHDPGGPGPASPWADSASLVALGFDPEALSTGHVVELRRGVPQRRPGWVLLRFDPAAAVPEGAEPDLARSRLVPVAVGTDPRALLRAADDPAAHLVLRGVVGISRYLGPPDSAGGAPPAETWAAAVHLVTPRFLHVPRSLVPVLDRLAPVVRSSEAPRYLVRVSTGRFQLPWVTGVFPVVQ